MDWLKKNWKLVAWIAGCLLILGGAVGFLFKQYSYAREAAAKLQQQTQELDRLVRMNPHPGNDRVDNIKAAKEQQKEIESLIEKAKQVLQPIQYPTNLTSGQFRLLLDRTIAELTKKARQSGVRIPADFAFSFDNIRNRMSFDSKFIPTLTRQLIEVKTISEILFDAKVLTLDAIRRTQVLRTNQPSQTTASPFGPAFGAPAPAPTPPPSPTPSYGMGLTSSNFWDREIITNDLAIITPYEFTFHCFTEELARFLYGIAQAKKGIVVKNIAVDGIPSSLLETPYSGMGFAEAGGHAGGMGATEMARYGIAPRMGMGYAGSRWVPRQSGGQLVLVEERPFRVRAWIYVVRLLTPEEAALIKSQQGAMPMAPGAGGGAYPYGPGAYPYGPAAYPPPMGAPQPPPGLMEHH